MPVADARHRHRMQRLRLDEVAGGDAAGRVRARGVLPFGFGGQPRAVPGVAVGRRPARKRVGLEVADVRDRRVRVDRHQPVQREAGPAAIALALPVQRRLDLVLAHPIPAGRQPPARVGVAAVGDELGPFAVGDQAVAERVRPQLLAMPRALVVEGEAGAVVPDLDQPTRVLDPMHRPAAPPRPAATTRGTPAPAGCTTARA